MFGSELMVKMLVVFASVISAPITNYTVILPLLMDSQQKLSFILSPVEDIR